MPVLRYLLLGEVGPHDELAFEVPPQELVQMRELVRIEMETAVPLYLPLKVDIGDGKTRPMRIDESKKISGSTEAGRITSAIRPASVWMFILFSAGSWRPVWPWS